MRVVLDMESDGLLDTITKMHCVCYYDIDTEQSGSLTDYQEIKDFLEQDNLTIVGHNIVRFDTPAFKKLGVNFKGKKIDTLGISWYLYPLREDHNLANWGNDMGIEKPIVDDWQGLSVEVYVHRCQEDVKINTKLFFFFLNYLLRIYNDDVETVNRLFAYITFKLECATEQEEMKWKIDVIKATENLEYLIAEREVKFEKLKAAMPRVNITAIRSKPKVMYKKNGEVSALGVKWLALLQERGLPEYHNGAIEIITGSEEGNPRSFPQLKKWLTDLGWQPETFKWVKDSPSSPMRAIPQISLADGSDICPSIKNLYEIEPNLEYMESFFILNHRIGFIATMLEYRDKDNFVVAGVNGFTNTMRFTHVKPLANIPTVSRAYGELVRQVMIAPTPQHILCGTDMTSLEDSTKQHYMYKYDPEYVKEMQKPGFDPHLDLALQGKMVTEDDIVFYKNYEKKVKETNGQVEFTEEEKGRYKKIKRIRGYEGKKTNFAAVYGVGVVKLSLTNNWHQDKARKLLNIYWKRNWAVKKVAQNCIVKTVNGQMWLYNPVSQFWYSLRYEKDKFSTLNQSTGVYCFDSYVRNCRKRGIKTCGQFHDEFISPLYPRQREDYKRICKEAIDETNDELKLNVTLRISIDFGLNYSLIH